MKSRLNITFPIIMLALLVPGICFAGGAELAGMDSGLKVLVNTLKGELGRAIAILGVIFLSYKIFVKRATFEEVKALIIGITGVVMAEKIVQILM